MDRNEIFNVQKMMNYLEGELLYQLMIITMSLNLFGAISFIDFRRGNRYLKSALA